MYNNYHRSEKKRSAPSFSNLDYLSAAAYPDTTTITTTGNCKKSKTTATHYSNNNNNDSNIINNDIDNITFDSFTEETTKLLESARVQQNRPRHSEANRKIFQLRCIHHNNNNDNASSSPAATKNKLIRILLVHGATPLFALNRYIAKSFGMMITHKPFDHRLTKGHNPPNSFFAWKDNNDNAKKALVSGTKTAILKVMENKNPPFLSDRKVYVEDVFIQRGDSLEYYINHKNDSNQLWSVTIICDGVTKPQKDSLGTINFPMLVGADKSLNKLEWFQINDAYNGGRETEWILLSKSLSSTQQRDAIQNTRRIPYFDNTGHEYTHKEKHVGFDGIKVLHEQVLKDFVPDVKKKQQSVSNPENNEKEDKEEENEDYRKEDEEVSDFFNKLPALDL